MSGRSPLGSGLYFLDVLACLLFAIVLALVGARFTTETIVDIDLPEIAADAGAGPSLAEREVAIRDVDGEIEWFFDGQPMTERGLRERLANERPPALVIRSENSALSRVVGWAHESGVTQIELAYDAKRGETK